jgi:hypothetical protein
MPICAMYKFTITANGGEKSRAVIFSDCFEMGENSLGGEATHYFIFYGIDGSERAVDTYTSPI